MESLFTIISLFFREITMCYSTGHGKNTYKLTPNDQIFSSNRSVIQSESKKKFSLRYSNYLIGSFKYFVADGILLWSIDGISWFRKSNCLSSLDLGISISSKFFKTGIIIWRQFWISYVIINDILSHFPDFWRQKQSIYVWHNGINKKLSLNFYAQGAI